MEEILKALNYQPINISDEDLDNPVPSITYFFVNHPFTKPELSFGSYTRDGFILQLNRQMVRN